MGEKLKMWYLKQSNQFRDSVTLAFVIVGGISTILSIVGWSLADLKCLNFWYRLLIFVIVYLGACFIIFKYKERHYQNSVTLEIRGTTVTVEYGDIFEAEGWKVIGCDTHFDTRVDDVIISKSSLHGRLVLEHGKKDEIDKVVKEKAEQLRINKNSEGLYDFELGTIIPYHSSVDNQTYLMLAMTELNEKHEAHTNMALYENMLMKMWAEIDTVYASHDIVLPVLGTGISRFDDRSKNPATLLKCMLCTLNSSGKSYNSEVKVKIYKGKNTKSVNSLYEYRNMFNGDVRG